MILDQDTACVLLFYKYVDIGDQRRQVADWFREACRRLQLKGRIRVALDGVNVTVCAPTHHLLMLIGKRRSSLVACPGFECVDSLVSAPDWALD